MNKRNLRSSLCTCAMAVACTFAVSAQAAEQTVKFIVPNKQIQALGIQTAPLQSQTASILARYPAQVIVPPKAEQVVSSPVSGLVAQLLVQQNQVVGSGAALVRLVSPELGQVQLQLLQASSRATLARQAAQREQSLFKEGIIPQRRVQEAQANLSEAEAMLNQARAALRLSGMSAAAIKRVTASGMPEDSIVLVAKQAGIVTNIAVMPGQRVEAATALLTVAQTDSLWLDIQLPVAESANWLPGTKVQIPGRDVTARILSASPTVSSSSQTVALRAAIEGKSTQVRPGEFVTVALPVAATQDSWVVPLSAVVYAGKQAYLFVRTKDGFEGRSVQVTASAGQQVRVQGALANGEQIAVRGVVALKGAWLDAKESK
ncbi:MAG: efflux RND transporter periplasmic adaptor subunit [Sulfuriferula multivorans]|uniref:Efflux RND transporter periplasmic adaptor subunit n=1 Tax=Sulfuriferula multivorans TaxID=1559896 RepID=A0A7C9P6W3_9PROT|nr:efflux RND transporter periplasmic adaptor subunit [Sulfuriferula multivorans]